MRRGTQGHVAVPRGPAQRAYVARIHTIYFYLLYIVKRSSAFAEEGLLTLLNVGYYIPDSFLYYFPCGTKFCVLLTVQATWRNVERRIKGPINRHASIVWSADHWIAIKPRALNRCVITAEMRRRGSHLSRRIVI